MHLFLVTVLILTLASNLVCQRHQICKHSSIMAPPFCHCPGLPFLLWPLTNPSPPTQVQQSCQNRQMHWLKINHILFIFYRKPNNSCVCYISEPSWLLRLLYYVTTILISQPVLDVLPTWARRSSTAVEWYTGETHTTCRTYCINSKNSFVLIY